MAKTARLADRLTPVTWWSLGLTLAVLASLVQTPQPLVFLVVLAFAGMVSLGQPRLRRSSVRIYGGTALFVLVVRVAFRFVFNVPATSQVAVSLPVIQFQIFANQVTLLGPVSSPNLIAGVTDGLRLAAIILAVGFAASVANPRSLIKSAPAVLYEFATATTIALNVAPQLISSLNRVRRARVLRGGTSGLASLRGVIIPVLEDTIQRSLDLAASMDSRGFGRRGAMRLRVVYSARAAAGIGVMLFGTACYLLLASASSVFIGLITFALGLVCIAVSARLAGMHRVRTRLITAYPKAGDWLVRLLCLSLVLVTAVENYSPAGQVLEWRP